jgi:hypothetical protein
MPGAAVGKEDGFGQKFWRRLLRGKGLNLDLRFRDFEARV